MNIVAEFLEQDLKRTHREVAKETNCSTEQIGFYLVRVLGTPINS
jgi:hypothetical protein